MTIKADLKTSNKQIKSGGGALAILIACKFKFVYHIVKQMQLHLEYWAE